MDALADADQTVFVAAGDIEKLQLLRRFLGIGHEFRWWLRVRRRRKSTDPRKRVEVRETDVQRLSAAHREPGQRAALAIRFHGIVRLDERNDVFDQIVLEWLAPAG